MFTLRIRYPAVLRRIPIPFVRGTNGILLWSADRTWGILSRFSISLVRNWAVDEVGDRILW